MRRLTAAVAALSLATTGFAAAATAPTPPLRAPHLHPASDSPEAGIWDLMDRAEAHARAAADLDRDPELTAFVRSVALKLAPEYDGDLRVYVLDRPFFQAQCASNGYIEVWSGLLLRVADEDELAFVLGHEISHFARNHSLAEWNKTKHEANVRMAFAVGVSAVAAGAMYSAAASGGPYSGQAIRNISQSAQSLTDLFYLASVASVFSFGRDQESEADALGFGRAVAAGYRPEGATDVWEAQVAETRNSDFKHIRDSETRASIFLTHPLDGDRIAALKALETKAPPCEGRQARRRPRLPRPHPPAPRRLAGGRPAAPRLQPDAASARPAGRAGRRQRRARLRPRRDLPQAPRGWRRPPGPRAYREATAAADAPPEAWREAGEAELKSGDKAAARLALAAYVEKRPDASDRWMVDADLKTLSP